MCANYQTIRTEQDGFKSLLINAVSFYTRPHLTAYSLLNKLLFFLLFDDLMLKSLTC